MVARSVIHPQSSKLHGSRSIASPPWAARLFVFFVTAAALAITALGLLGLTPLGRFQCTFHALTGLYCPGCGGTRAASALLQGHLREALHNHALFVISLPVALYGGVSVLIRIRWKKHLPGGRCFERPTLYVAALVILLVFTFIRNLPGEPWSMLAPIPDRPLPASGISADKLPNTDHFAASVEGRFGSAPRSAHPSCDHGGSE